MTDKSNKNIIIVLSSFRSGGAEKMMIFLANGFSQRGYTVTLLVLRSKGPFKKLIDEKVSTVEGPQLKSIYFYIPWLMFQFIKANPSNIISTQRHVNIITIISALGLFKKDKVLIREANPPSVSKENEKFKISINSYLAKILYPLVKKHVAISEHVKRSMVSYYRIIEKKIKVIYSPVITDSLYDKSRESINESWIDNNSKLILSVGRVSQVKDYLTLIRAFRKVVQFKKCQLLILGDKADKEYYSMLIKHVIDYNLQDFVKFGGFVDNPYAYMSKADLLVLSSKWEGFGNVLVEALACGCPIVSTDCPGGPREILDNGKYGRLVTVGGYEEMAKAILESLDETINKNMLKSRGFEFTQERSVNKYLNYMFQ